MTAQPQGSQRRRYRRLTGTWPAPSAACRPLSFRETCEGAPAPRRKAPAFVINAPIAHNLKAVRNQLEISTSTSGLYEAILELPTRQFTVIALRHLLGYKTTQIARYMGLDTRTVDYHGRKGKERLRVQLKLPAAPAKPHQGVSFTWGAACAAGGTVDRAARATTPAQARATRCIEHSPPHPRPSEASRSRSLTSTRPGRRNLTDHPNDLILQP
jgi:hypothetical protein